MNEFHPKLEEQINNFIGQNSRLKKKIAGFLSVVNSTYEQYDEKLNDNSGILSKYEATLLDKGILMHQNQVLSNEVQLNNFHLQQSKVQISNFEKLSNAGSFKFNLKSGIMVNSNQMSKMFDITEYEYNIENFTALFVESKLINEALINSKLTKSSILFEEIQLINEKRFFSINGEVISERGEEILQVVVKDLTAIKKHEHELENAILNLEFYKSVIDQTVILTTFNLDGKIIFVNDNFTDIAGYSNLEMIGKNFDFLTFDSGNEASISEIIESLDIYDNWKGTVKNKDKNGHVFWLDTTIIPFISDEKIKKFISIQVDVTDKLLKEQKVEEQRAFYETILNNLPLDIAVFNKNHEYLFVNHLGISNPETRAFLIGKTDYDYCKQYNKDISIADARQAIFDQVLESKKQLEFTDKLLGKDGKDVYVLRKFFPFMNTENELEYMLGIGVDVTEKTEQSIQIKESLIEKDALLGEVHHRVKNNLSIFLGLVEMQMKRMKDKNLINEFTEIKNRIISMSLIHEKLYKSSNFAQIDLKEYTLDFVKYLSEFFDADQNVKISFEMDEVFANTKNTVPVALIINELITNSYKHAFVGVENPTINIKLNEVNSFVELSISDNGIGLEKDFESMQLDSLGIKLIHIFAKQLKADLEVVNENGLSFNFKFKNETPIDLIYSVN